MLNKYIALYDKIVQDLVALHNANQHFRNKISQTSALEVRRAVKSLHSNSNQLRSEVLKVQKEHKQWLKTQRLEYKARLKAQKKPSFKKKEK
jgi:hypothetical protein